MASEFVLRWLRQLVMLLFVVCFLMSGLVLNVFQLFVLPFWWINRRLYRIANAKIVYFHWALIPWAVERWAGYNIRIFTPHSSDFFNSKLNGEHALCVLNHRGDMDWMIGWCLIERAGMLGGAKAVMKDVAKFIPGIGWMFYLLEFPIIKRDWNKDEGRLTESCKQLSDNYPVYMLLCLFAEGTRFTKEKHDVSVAFAKEKGLPILKHHLHPRPKGFTFLVNNLKETIPAIYDITFGYGEGEPNILGVMDQVPCSCDISVRRFPMSEVPTGSDEECAKWLTKLYQEKDEIVDYHLKHKTFPLPYHEIQVPTRPWPNVVMAMWILILGFPIISFVSYLIYIGAWYTLVGVAISIILINQLFYFVIRLTEVRYGSDQGLKRKSNNKDNNKGKENGKIDHKLDCTKEKKET